MKLFFNENFDFKIFGSNIKTVINEMKITQMWWNGDMVVLDLFHFIFRNFTLFQHGVAPYGWQNRRM